LKKENILSVLLVVFLVLSIILVSYHATAFRTSLYPSADHQNVRNYLIGSAELTVDMTEREISHLRDVKLLMTGVFVFTILALVKVGVCSFFLRKKKDMLLRGYKKAGIATIITLFVLGIVGASSFNFLFTAFHQLFFPQGNYAFPASSMIITLFPLNFFIARSIEIVIVSVLLASIFIGVSVYLEKKK